ncbi:hypothetical protein [Sphaerisporangium album]|uniref:hypothetical protein n=1 Tax=Sphaerisporangium album TaxID=509200 RepID=UPI0011C04978|nr:hypothetical protein [Sphaerisporangium album]
MKLPHTDLEVPHTRLRITSHRFDVHGSDGDRYIGVLRLNTRRVGRVTVNDALPIHPHSGNVQATPPRSHVSFEPISHRFGWADLHTFTGRCRSQRGRVTPEQVLADLMEEHLVNRMVSKCQARGGALARLRHEGTILYFPLRTCPRTPEERLATVRYLQRVAGRQEWQMWQGARWGPLVAGT